MDALNDKQLVTSVLSGDDGAFRILIGKHERLVTHMIAKVVSDDMDREELCQDVFVKVQKSWTLFISTLSYLHGSQLYLIDWRLTLRRRKNWTKWIWTPSDSTFRVMTNLMRRKTYVSSLSKFKA